MSARKLHAHAWVYRGRLYPAASLYECAGLRDSAPPCHALHIEVGDEGQVRPD